MTEIPIIYKDYIPYPSAISVHNNVYSEGKRMPTWKNKLGLLFWLKFGKKAPHILYDGIQNPDWTDASGALKTAYRICIKDNQNGTVANLKADKKFKGISKSLASYDCSIAEKP